MSSQTGERLMGMFTYMLAGYLIGLVIGFTVFDPDLDVWALLGAVLAIIGLFAGMLPVLRRYMHVTLMALLGFYVGMLLGTVLFGDLTSGGLLDSVQDGKISLVMVIFTAAGFVIGLRAAVARFRVPLFGFVLGGFLTPLVLLAVFQIKESDMALAPLVIASGLFWGGVALWFQSRHVAV